ncbi:TPA: hypothetical protein PC521_005196 [Klebsiella michiganensis]|nr:hypothetical protein [Klebsiella michiganensis]
MADQIISIKPNHMTATSTLITPDKDEAIITFYSHEFSHRQPTEGEQSNTFQVKVELTPQLAVSLSPKQAMALVKSLQGALRDNGLWKE